MHWHIGKWFFSRQFFTHALLGATLLAASATASAQGMYQQDEQGDYANWEFTPFYGYMFGGQFEDPVTNTDRDVNEDNNYGIFIDAAADEWRHYELIYTKQGTSVDGAPKMDWIDAPRFPITLLERTVTPRTRPRCCVTR